MALGIPAAIPAPLGAMLLAATAIGRLAPSAATARECNPVGGTFRPDAVASDRYREL